MFFIIFSFVFLNIFFDIFFSGKKEMKHKLLGIDLDGTLLNKFKKISYQNLDAISEYINMGGIPVITTGRSYISAKKYFDQIADFCQQPMKYLVAFNGAYILETSTNKSIQSLIDSNVVSDILKYANDKKINM